MSAVRTPGPWKVETLGHGLRVTKAIHEDDNDDIAGIGDCLDAVNQANAAFIVEACNNYERVCAERDELAEALKRFCNVYESDSPLRPAAMVNECRKAREALAKVRP